MSNPTNEQALAINEKKKNIIVSAGAGSGKTFVLKERVLRIVKEGTSIDDLIILTFTRNAADEMKERIRKILVENNIADAEYVDSAYITTFDSFAGSIVRKYNYLLGMSKDFNIIDAAVVEPQIRLELDNILEEKYAKKETSFTNFIDKLCYKDDASIRKDIITVYKSLNNIIDKNKFLGEYIDKYYNDSFVEEMLDKYETNIFNELSNYIELLELATEYIIKDENKEFNNTVIEELKAISSLDELVDSFSELSIKNNSGGKVYSEEYKPLGPVISKTRKSFDDYLKYHRNDLKKQYLSTKDSVIELIDIVSKLDEQMAKFKEEHNAYEYNDIALKAIELVANNEDIRNEIKNKTAEIMIDEYQDTNDIQDKFISYIANNNVYMVGDVKQSIYSFRNANPSLFKKNYDNYANNSDEGMKIDLTSNFRSRKEVINNINDIFSSIMFDDIGGADYDKTHRMNFGKTLYDDFTDKDVDYNVSLLNYSNEDKKYSNAVIEAFIIAKDIKEKMKNKRHTVHEINKKDEFIDISYKDFCILVDNSNNFETIKKVLEYNEIPATIDKDLSIKEDDEIYILKSLITCLTNIINNTYDKEFKHAYASVARSYICEMSDQDLHEAIKSNKYKDTELFKKLKEISTNINALSNKEIIYKLIDELDVVNKTIHTGNINERLAKLEYFINEADSLNKFGMDIYTMKEFFNDLLASDDDIKMGRETNNSDAVKIMTIHGSKGLEFNYVYMPYLDSQFQISEKGNLTLDKDLGFIVPFYDDGLDKTFMYQLNKQKNRIDVISEKIRLFYVAITRAKEQFILVSQFNDKLFSDGEIESRDMLKCKSFRDFVTLLKPYFSKYTHVIDIESLGINENYTSVKKNNYKKLISPTSDKLSVNELIIDNQVMDNKHFSKELTKLVDKEFKELLNKGTKAHLVFEVYDFNSDISTIKEEYQKYINNFLNHDEVKDIKNAKVYKEHEISYKADGATHNGVIDLLVEYDDHFDIIDYKLSNLDSDEYKEQLGGYKDYIETTYNKPTNIYLYSIKKDIFKKL